MLSSRYAALSVLTLLLMILTIGCGGSGGSSSTGGQTTGGGTAIAKVPLYWNAQSRAIEGPSIAASAVLTFREASLTGEDVSSVVERRTNPDAYNEIVSSQQPVRTGTHVLRVIYHAEPSGQGAVVANAAVSVAVQANGTLTRADGTPLGQVGSDSTLQSVEVVQGQSVRVGEAIVLDVSARTAEGYVFPIPAGAVEFQVFDGSGSATMNAEGRLVGVREGFVDVTAMVEGVSGNRVQVTIGPKETQGIRSLTQASNDMVVDPVSGTLWVSVPSTAASNGNRVVHIDPQSGTILGSVFVGSEPDALAISSDGSTLYVALQGAGAIRRVDTATTTAGLKFDLDPAVFASDPVAIDLAVQPGNNNVVAVTRHDRNSSGYMGACIYENGVKLPNELYIYEGDYIAFATSDRLWCCDGNGTFRAKVDAQGATKDLERDGPILLKPQAHAGRIYGLNGTVADDLSGASFGTFSFQGQYAKAFTVDAAAHRAFFVTEDFSTSSLYLQVFDTDEFTPVTQQQLNIGEDLSPYLGYEIVRFGAKGLAFRTGSKVYFIDNAPGL